MRDAIAHSGLRDGRDRVSAADDRHPFHLGHGPGDRDRASGERVDFEDAHRPVPDDGLCAGDDGSVRVNRARADIEAHAVPDGRIADRQDFRRHPGFDLLGDDVIGGQLEAEAARLCPRLDLARGIEQVIFHERFPDRNPARLEEGVRHRAADEQGVDARNEILDDLELVGHFRAAEHGDERPVGAIEHASEVLEFRGHEQARGRILHEPDDPFRRRMGAMRGAEGVVDVDVGERRELLREAGVVLLFLGMKPEILEEHDAIRACAVDRGRGRRPDRILREFDGTAEQLRQPFRDRPQRKFRVRLPLRPAEMRTQNHRGAAIERVPDRGDRGSDTGVVRDRAVSDRHVEVDAHQHAPALEWNIGDAALRRHRPFLIISRRRSTQRFE